MNVRGMRRAGRAALAVGLGVVGSVGGAVCASGQSGAASSVATASEADVLALKERAATFWAARVAGDLETQWQFLEPRWKGRMTAAEYGGDLTAGRWLAYQVEEVAVNGLFATVKVRLLVQQNQPAAAGARTRFRPQAGVAEDGWIRVNGLWYRRLDPGGGAAPQAAQP